MSLDTIIAKLKATEGLDLSEDEITELQSFGKNNDDSTLKEEKAAKARILEEKKKAQQKATELESELEELRNKDLSDQEKITKELEKAQNAQKKAIEDYEGLQKQLQNTVKSYKLEKIANGIKFVDTIPNELKSIAIEKSFGAIDLDDENAIKDANKDFTKTYASIIASEDAPKGSGGKPGQTNKSGNKAPEEMNTEERAQYLRNRKK